MLLCRHHYARQFSFASCRGLRASSIATRRLSTLAIETSCDDTSVAVLEWRSKRELDAGGGRPQPKVTIRFHEKITANNLTYGGIHPVVSMISHQQNLPHLIQAAMESLPLRKYPWKRAVPSREVNRKRTSTSRQKCIPDFISVTRGPGMRSSLTIGLETAKGLAMAWGVPLIGVHHMQAHALTPRLAHALENTSSEEEQPAFPFLTLLVSGGHTLLVHSRSLVDHQVLGSTMDIAVGDALDKIARHVLPSAALEGARNTMYGAMLEQWAFPEGSADYDYQPPNSSAEEYERRMTKWNWGFTNPLGSPSVRKAKALDFSFSGSVTAAYDFTDHSEFFKNPGGRIPRLPESIHMHERRDLAREAMRMCFEHLASRVANGLDQLRLQSSASTKVPQTLVVSGGVASNSFLRHVLRSYLDKRGYQAIGLQFPPPWLCTDNACMIGWAGLEMYKNGYRTDLSCDARRTWSMDNTSEDGGILGAEHSYKSLIRRVWV